jgi:hypothetical protein
VVHSVAGIFDGHPPRFDLLFGGAAEGQAGGQQPAGRQGAVKVAAFLPAPDELEHPVENRGVPAGILLGAYCWQVPDEGVAGGHLPARLDQPDQRGSGGQVVQPGGVEGRRHLRGGVLDDGIEQRLPGWEVGIDGLPADPGGPGDVLHAGAGIRVQGLGGRLQDRGDALPGVGPLPSAPGLRLC